MIKCDRGSLEIRGTVIDLSAELATLIRALRNDFVEAGMPKGEADKLMRRIMDDGMMTDDEVDAELAKEVKEKLKPETDEQLAQQLMDLIKKVWDKKGDK